MFILRDLRPAGRPDHGRDPRFRFRRPLRRFAIAFSAARPLRRFGVSAEQQAPGRRQPKPDTYRTRTRTGSFPGRASTRAARAGRAEARVVSCRVCCVMAALRACVPVLRTRNRVAVLLEWNSPVHLLCSGLWTPGPRPDATNLLAHPGARRGSVRGRCNCRVLSTCMCHVCASFSSTYSLAS